MNIELLIEAIKDMAKDTNSVHYTNIDGLVGILNSEHLKGANYIFKSNTRTSPELAVLRRSVDADLKHLKVKNPQAYEMEIKKLSENIGPFKIYLHTNRIVNTVRGTTKRPIAELNRMNASMAKHVSELSRGYLEVRRAKYTEKDYEKAVSDTLKEIVDKEGLPFLANMLNRQMEPYAEKLMDRLKLKGLFPRKGFMSLAMDSLFKYRYLQYPSTMGREGEERIAFEGDKHKGVPVNNLLMKIRIMPYDIEKDLIAKEDEDLLASKFIALRKDLNKFERVFMKDALYKKFLADIDELINKHSI